VTTDHPCQLCGERHPARYQFDAKEHGGAKVTCARCVAGLLAARDAEINRLQADLDAALTVCVENGLTLKDMLMPLKKDAEVTRLQNHIAGADVHGGGERMTAKTNTGWCGINGAIKIVEQFAAKERQREEESKPHSWKRSHHRDRRRVAEDILTELRKAVSP
jgi:hypothetical protein